jgi:DnaJ-domain-containing protein 1
MKGSSLIMQVFFRLIRILRARLHVGLADDPSNRYGRWEQYDQTLGNGAYGASQSGRTGHDVDPTLAGYYANLGVPYGSDLATVRRAWKRLVRKYHPDIHSEDPEKRRVANELTQGLNRAYEELAKRLEK